MSLETANRERMQALRLLVMSYEGTCNPDELADFLHSRKLNPYLEEHAGNIKELFKEIENDT